MELRKRKSVTNLSLLHFSFSFSFSIFLFLFPSSEPSIPSTAPNFGFSTESRGLSATDRLAFSRQQLRGALEALREDVLIPLKGPVFQHNLRLWVGFLPCLLVLLAFGGQMSVIILLFFFSLKLP